MSTARNSVQEVDVTERSIDLLSDAHLPAKMVDSCLPTSSLLSDWKDWKKRREKLGEGRVGW